MRRLVPLLSLALFSSAARAQAPRSLPAAQSARVRRPAPNPRTESNVEYFWRKSDEAFHAGDYPRAVGLHRAIVALDPTDTESYGVGAWLLWSMGKKDEALQFLNEGVKANPHNPDMWDEVGQNNDLQKHYPEAAAAYGHAVEFSPPGENTQMLRRRFAHATEKAQDLNAAAEIWRGLVRDFPSEVVNRNNLARVERQISEKHAALLKQRALLVGRYAALAAAAGGALYLPMLALSRRKAERRRPGNLASAPLRG